MMGHHFVLVHGVGHGAWCWYKLVVALRSKGHKATALDLGGCGASGLDLKSIRSIDDYHRPLIEFMENSVKKGEKVVLVGHSFGGLGISFAMEKFPDKVSVAVYISAYMPNFSIPPSIFIDESLKRNSAEQFVDSVFSFENGPQKQPTSIMFGPNFLSTKLYELCQPEDLELAKLMVRPNRLFKEELSKKSLLTKEKYGSVDRAFVMLREDKIMNDDFQHWIINHSPPKVVKIIKSAGHMAMLSKPRELCSCLIEIADGIGIHLQ